MSKPGRRIVIKTVRKDVSRIVGVRPGLGIHPHADRFLHRGGGSGQRPVQSSLPAAGRLSTVADRHIRAYGSPWLGTLTRQGYRANDAVLFPRAEMPNLREI